MALTKKEQEHLTNIIKERDTFKKMVFSLLGIEEIIRDIPIPSFSTNSVNTGWDYNVFTGNVSPVWSTSVSHGTGSYDKRGTGSQKGRESFSTQELATRALHSAYKLKMLEDLIKIT